MRLTSHFLGSSWALLLLAAPLSAQQTVVYPDIQNTVNVEPTPIINQINVMSDSLRDERIAAALESMAAEIAERGCDQCGGTSTVVRIGQGALLTILAWGVYELRQLRLKEDVPDVHNDGDVKVEVNVPDHPPQPKHPKHEHDDDYGEGR